MPNQKNINGSLLNLCKGKEIPGLNGVNALRPDAGAFDGELTFK
jgi:hypothetical protein